MLDTLEDGFVPDPLQPATHNDIAALRKEMSEQFAIIMPVVQSLAPMPEQMRRMVRIVDGVPEEDIKGLRPRVGKLEEKQEEYDRYVTIAKVFVPILATIVIALLLEALKRYIGGP